MTEDRKTITSFDETRLNRACEFTQLRVLFKRAPEYDIYLQTVNGDITLVKQTPDGKTLERKEIYRDLGEFRSRWLGDED